MTKGLVYSFVIVFLAAGCGVPTAKYDQALLELTERTSERDSLKKTVEDRDGQVKELSMRAGDLKKENDDLLRQKELLEAKTAELTQQIQKVEQLEKATQTYEDLTKKLEKEIQEGQIQITEMKNRLTMTLVDKILFPSGSADISREGKQVLDKVIAILKDVKDKRIQVEGHTDNVKIYSSLKTRFPTNWELSTARATQVVKYLQEDGGLDPALLSATGYSEYQPVAPNDSDAGRRKNRRIEIVLLPLVQ